MSKEMEVNSSDAPPHLSNEEAHAWVSGYNARQKEIDMLYYLIYMLYDENKCKLRPVNSSTSTSTYCMMHNLYQWDGDLCPHAVAQQILPANIGNTKPINFKEYLKC
jgi:hypothetical protein